ncbi:MAG: MFS transporter [Gammaproteobacteria bacterium]|nr:MFS transporter [Gammaproteobacteria bacterium]
MSQRFTWPRLLAYGLLGVPLAVLGLPLYVYLPTFFAEDIGIAIGTVGTVLLVARLVDMFTDPLIGTASDYLPTRWGRRYPWLLAGAPMLMAGSWYLFVPPTDAGAGYLLLWSLVTYLGWTLVILPYTALGAEISDDYHVRSRITVSREGFVILGTLLAVGIPGVLEYQGVPRGEALRVLAWFLLVVIPLAVIALLAAIREPRQRTETVNLKDGWKILKKNRSFTRLLVAYLLNGLANGLPASLFLLFVNHVLDKQEWTGIYLGVYFLAGVVSLPLWLNLAGRFGKHRVWIASMLWASLVFVWVPFLGAGDIWWFMAICVLSGVSLGVDQALPASIQADVVDEDTAEGGGGRAGLYFGLWSMATKLSLALAVGIAFPLLELAGFDPQSGAAENGGLMALALMYGGLPVLFKLASTWLVWDFPLDEARQQALRDRIAANGAQGATS